MKIGKNANLKEDPMEIFLKMIADLKSEKLECLDLLRENEAELSEVNIRIKNLDQKMDRDLHIFSPRNVGESSFEDMEKEISHKEQLEVENQNLTTTLNKISKRLVALSELSNQLDSTNSEHTFDESSSDFMDLDSDKKLIILDIQEKERQRIARDLHDSSLQSLIHLIHKLELCSKYIDVDPVEAKLEIATCKKLLKELIDDGRNLIFNLRPMSFDDLGFLEVIRRLEINLRESSDIEIIFQVDDVDSKDPLFCITIFRIIQELVTNAVKHSNGSKVYLTAAQNDSKYIIQVEDNGVGFKREDIKNKHNHFGITMVEEQVHLLSGDIRIQSELGRGTKIIVEIPLL